MKTGRSRIIVILVVLFFGVRENVSLTCYDCLEPCEENAPMCGGLYCARLKVTDIRLTYSVLHACLNSNHLTSNTTLEVDKCYNLESLDSNWTEDLALVTRHKVNLTSYYNPLINICDQSDTFCNETSCELSDTTQDNGNRSHEHLIIPILGSWLIYALIDYLGKM